MRKKINMILDQRDMSHHLLYIYLYYIYRFVTLTLFMPDYFDYHTAPLVSILSSDVCVEKINLKCMIEINDKYLCSYKLFFPL